MARRPAKPVADATKFQCIGRGSDLSADVRRTGAACKPRGVIPFYS